MIDNSPVLLRLDPQGVEYEFYIRTLSMYNKMLFPDGYKPEDIRPDLLEKFDFKAYTRLEAKFALDANQSSTVDISLLETLWLLIAVHSVAKLLVSEDADAFKAIIEEERAISTSNWDSMYLKDAQILFANYRIQFQKYPRLIQLIDQIGELSDSV